MADDKFEERWGNFRDLVTHMFQESGHPCPDSDIAWYPATDAYQTEDSFVVRMDLSGVAREDVRIQLAGDVLEVRGHRRDPSPSERRRFHKMEIAIGPFIRRLQLPQEFGRGEAKATYRDGILEIRLGAAPGGPGGTIDIESL